MASNPLNILIVGSELTPLAKAGGLGDVLGSLPKALVPKVASVAVALPFYDCIDRSLLRALRKHSTLRVPVGSGFSNVTVWVTTLPNSRVPLYLFSNRAYLNRGTPYSGTSVLHPTTGRAAESRAGQRIRFAFFSAAVHLFLAQNPNTFSIIHGNDYHTAVLLARVKSDPTLTHLRTILTIHNMGIVGSMPSRLLKLFLPNLYTVTTNQERKRAGGVRLLKLAIEHADAVNTVSPTYAREILTPEFSSGLHTVLRKHAKPIRGILNGIDETLFNPSKDPYIHYPYSYNTLGAKTKNKLQLQKTLGLPVDARAPLITLVHRLTYQKGLEFIIDGLQAVPKLSAQYNTQWLFVGIGAEHYEHAFALTAARYPGNVYYYRKFDIAFSQQAYAASDMFLMPSRFEPCGLSQIIAMRYGSVPIVRATGGLKDTVQNEKNGFTFTTASSTALWRTIWKAHDIYAHQPTRWKHMQRRGMTADFSWTSSALKYVKLYQSVLLKK